MTVGEAKEIAYHFLRKMSSVDLMIDDEATVERAGFWVFYANSPEYIKTKDFKYALIGGTLVAVDKDTGDTHTFGSAHPTDYYIEKHEKWLRRKRIINIVKHPWIIFAKRDT